MNKKDGNHLVQGLVNMVNWVEKYFLSVWFLLNVVLKYNVSPIDVCRAFYLKIFMHTFQLLRV